MIKGVQGHKAHNRRLKGRSVKNQLTTKFPDYDALKEHIVDLTVGLEGKCKECHEETGHFPTADNKYACIRCGYKWNPLENTIFDKKRIPAGTVAYVLLMLIASNGKIGAKALEKETGLPYVTVQLLKKEILERYNIVKRKRGRPPKE